MTEIEVLREDISQALSAVVELRVKIAAMQKIIDALKKEAK